MRVPISLSAKPISFFLPFRCLCLCLLYGGFEDEVQLAIVEVTGRLAFELAVVAEGLVERTRDRTRRQQRHARVWRPRKSRCAMDLLQLHGEGRDTEKRVMVREERDTANRQLGDDADVFKSRSAYVITHTSSSRRGSGGLLPFTMVSDCIVYVPASQDQRSGLLLGLYALRKRQGLTTRGE